MKIKFHEYTLQPGQFAKDRWDILKTGDITMNNTPLMKNKYGDIPSGQIVGVKEEEMDYDMHLDHAIAKIISYRMAEKEDVVDLNGFLTAYKKERAELESLIKL